MTAAEIAIARAEHLITVKRHQEAMSALGPALADTSTAGVAFCLLAQCQLAIGRPKEARDAAYRAAAAEATGEWPHRLIALSELRLNHPRRALAAAEQAVRQDPGNDHALYVLTTALLGRRRRKQAVAVAERNVSTNPHSSMAFLALGQALTTRRRLSEAETAYRSALRLDPNDIDIALGLAELLRRMRRHEEAGQVYLSAGAMDPADHRVRRGLRLLGLPVVAIGTAKVLFGTQFIRIFLESIHSIRAIAVLWLAGMALGATVTTLLRLRGGRTLPEHVRNALKADYRNAALSWALVAGEGVVLLGLIGIIIAHGLNRDLRFGVFLCMLGAGLILLCRQFRIGPPVGIGRLLLSPFQWITGREN